MMYIGKTLDMFNQVGVLTLKSMLSLSVEQNELGIFSASLIICPRIILSMIFSA